jgi:hypothetical protein
MTTELRVVTEPSVALTKRPTLPGMAPEVKVTVEPVSEFRDPRRSDERVHEYEMPEGQVMLHVGVARKDWLAPSPMESDVGVTATDINVGDGLVTVIMAGML